MLELKMPLLKFEKMGEKTGWTYIQFNSDEAQILKPNNRKSFRVKGLIDQFAIKQVAILPMGDGNFVLPINAKMRKGIHKSDGAMVNLKLEIDESPLEVSEDLMDCLHETPTALAHFKSLGSGHQRYFSNWIEDAKTIETKTKRISQALWALERSLGYPEMIRHFKALKNSILE